MLQVLVTLSFIIKWRVLGPGYTRDWLPAYSFVLRARARWDTTRHDCYVMIPAHTGVTIVYCGTVVPSCSSQMSAQWLSITSWNTCEHSVNKSKGDWLLGVLVLRWIALRNGSLGNCSGLCSCSLDMEEENQETVLGTSYLQLQIVKRKILHPVQNLCEHPINIFSYFCVNISTFDELIRLVRPAVSCQNTNFRLCIPPDERIAVTIR
jgi:hypothetical protein